MQEVTIAEKCGRFEVRVNGDYICTAETLSEAVTMAKAYLYGGEQ